MVVMVLRGSEAQPHEITGRKTIITDRKTWLHKEQRQQASEMPGLKEDVETVRQKHYHL
jgi:hypothetical protein